MVFEQLDNQDFKPLKLHKKSKEEFSGSQEIDKKQEEKQEKQEKQKENEQLEQKVETNTGLKDVETSTEIDALEEEFDVFEGETGVSLTNMFEQKKEGIAYVVEGSGESALPSIFMKGITSDETILISYDMGYGSVRYIKAIATPLSPSLENKYAQDAEFLLPEMLATNLQMKDKKGRIVVHYGLKEGEEFPTRNVLPEEHVENTENTENTVDTENATISESPEQTTQKPLTSIQAKILGDANSLWQAHLENGKISLISPPPALVYNVATWKILVKDLEFDDAGIAKIQKNIDSLPYEISISVKDGEGILTLKNLTRAGVEGLPGEEGTEAGGDQAENNTDQTEYSVETAEDQIPIEESVWQSEVTHTLDEDLGVLGEIIPEFTKEDFRLLVLKEDGSGPDYYLDWSVAFDIAALQKEKGKKTVVMSFGGGYYNVTVDAGDMPLKISIEEKVMEESSEVPEDIDTDDDTPPEDAEVLDGEVYYFSKKNGRSTQKFGYEMVEGVYKNLKNDGSEHEDFYRYYLKPGDDGEIKIKRRDTLLDIGAGSSPITDVLNPDNLMMTISIADHAIDKTQSYMDTDGDVWEVTIENVGGILQVSVIAPLEEKTQETADAEEAAAAAEEEEIRQQQDIERHEAQKKYLELKDKYNGTFSVEDLVKRLQKEGRLSRTFGTAAEIAILTQACELEFVKIQWSEYRASKYTKLNKTQREEIEKNIGKRDGVEGITSDSEFEDAKKQVNKLIGSIEDDEANRIKRKNKYAGLLELHPYIDFDTEVLPQVNNLSTGSDVDSKEEYDQVLAVVNEIISLQQEEEDIEVMFDKKWEGLDANKISKLSYLGSPKAKHYYTQVQGGDGIPHNVSKHFKRSIDADGKANISGFPYSHLNKLYSPKNEYKTLVSHKIELNKNITVPLKGYFLSRPKIVVRFELGKMNGKEGGGIIMRIVKTPDTNSNDWLHALDEKERVLKKETKRPLAGGQKVVTSHFGMRKHPKDGVMKPHKGVDLRVSSNQAVLATMGGTISAHINKGGPNVGYGYYARIKHVIGGEVYYSLYGHLSKQGYELVKKKVANGGKVKAGEQIANAGGTGTGTGPHLHFELRKAANSKTSFFDAAPIDPIQFFDAGTIKVIGSDGKKIQMEESSSNDIGVEGGATVIPSSVDGFTNKQLSDISYGESIALFRDIFGEGPGTDVITQLAQDEYGDNTTQKKNFLLRILAIAYHEGGYDFGISNKDKHQNARGTFQVSSTDLVGDINKALTKAHEMTPDAVQVLQRKVSAKNDNYRVGNQPTSVKQADLLLWTAHILNNRPRALKGLGRVSEERLAEYIRDDLQRADTETSNIGQYTATDLGSSGAKVSKYVYLASVWEGVGEEEESYEEVEPGRKISTEIDLENPPSKISLEKQADGLYKHYFYANNGTKEVKYPVARINTTIKNLQTNGDTVSPLAAKYVAFVENDEFMIINKKGEIVLSINELFEKLTSDLGGTDRYFTYEERLHSEGLISKAVDVQIEGKMYKIGINLSTGGNLTIMLEE